MRRIFLVKTFFEYMLVPIFSYIRNMVWSKAVQDVCGHIGSGFGFMSYSQGNIGYEIIIKKRHLWVCKIFVLEKCFRNSFDRDSGIIQ